MGGGDGQRQRPGAPPVTVGPGLVAGADVHLQEAGDDQHQDHPRADQHSRRTSGEEVADPAGSRRLFGAGALPARGHSDVAAGTATAATAPAAALLAHSGGLLARNRADRASTRPDTMNAAPPTSAPGTPHNR